jgi:probable RNA-binding protein EIF1AD
MSGLGRRSHLRKHVTDSVLNQFPEPSHGEYIAQVMGSRGGNVLEILVPAASEDTDTCTNGSQKEASQELAILPTKYRKLIWVKRGDFIIVGGDDTTKASLDEQQQQQPSSKNKVRYMVRHILYKDQISHLKSLKLWPSQFLQQEEEQDKTDDKASTEREDDDDDDGDSLENDLFVNTNHLAKLCVHDDSSEEDGDEEEASKLKE